MDLLEQAKSRLEEARSLHAVLVADYEARLADLADDATADDVQAVIDEMEPQITEAEEVVQRSQAQYDRVKSVTEAREATKGLIPAGTVEERIEVVSEPLTYRRFDPDSPGFFADLYSAQEKHDRTAIERLQRGTKETLIETEKLGRMYHDREGRAMSSTGGSGGDFLPPLYFGDLYADFRRARRVTAKLVRNLPLAAKGNSITIPRITGGTAAAAQTGDNQTLSNVDATTALLTIPVNTVAAYNDLSRQIVERSDPGMDELIVTDLLKDYNKKVNSYVVNGTNSNGQPLGFYGGISGITVQTYTSATPTLPGLLPNLWYAVSKITEAVFEEATAVVMTARRWAWCLGQVDGSNRPLVVANGQGPFNALGLDRTGTIIDDAVPTGWIAGLPVYVDETLPKTQGVGTNQDSILVAAFNEHILWEDPAGPRQFTFEGVTSATAAIRVSVFGYMAFTAGRFPAATTLIEGTGLVAPY